MMDLAFIGCRYYQLYLPLRRTPLQLGRVHRRQPRRCLPAVYPKVPCRPRGVVKKCSFCVHGIDRGLAAGAAPGREPDATPACVVACTYGARLFGDLNDPESTVSIALHQRPDAYRLKEELGTGPRVYYLPAEPVLEESAS